MSLCLCCVVSILCIKVIRECHTYVTSGMNSCMLCVLINVYTLTVHCQNNFCRIAMMTALKNNIILLSSVLFLWSHEIFDDQIEESKEWNVMFILCDWCKQQRNAWILLWRNIIGISLIITYLFLYCSVFSRLLHDVLCGWHVAYCLWSK